MAVEEVAEEAASGRRAGRPVGAGKRGALVHRRAAAAPADRADARAGRAPAPRAGSLAATGHFAESRADLLESINIVPPGAEAWRVPVTTACAAVEHLLGLQQDAHRHLSTALAELGGTGSAEAVELMIELTAGGFTPAISARCAFPARPRAEDDPLPRMSPQPAAPWPTDCIAWCS
jgi:hypothetical protein